MLNILAQNSVHWLTVSFRWVLMGLDAGPKGLFFYYYFRGGTVVKRTNFSCRGSEYSSQHNTEANNQPLTPVPKNVMTSSALRGNGTHMMHGHACGKTAIHTK